MDRLDEMEVFVAILDAGSLAGAARRLRRSAPAVTRALAALEARVGAPLIERTTRRLTPTETGRRLGAEARQVLAGYGAALRPAADAAPRGVLRITAPVTFGRRHVMPVVASFLAAFPAMQAELVLADRNLDLLEDGMDVALRIGAVAETLPAVRRVGEVRSLVVASPGYLAARGEPRVPAELARHAVVLVVGRPLPPEWRFRAGRRESVVRLTPRLTVNDIDAALVAVRAGHGVTRVLSYQVADEMAAGTLVRLLRGYEPPALPVSLVTASVDPPPRVRAFLEHAVPRLEALAVARAEG
jgi:DNA-binding transcriptional LysR family regulator